MILNFSHAIEGNFYSIGENIMSNIGFCHFENELLAKNIIDNFFIDHLYSEKLVLCYHYNNDTDFKDEVTMDNYNLKFIHNTIYRHVYNVLAKYEPSNPDCANTDYLEYKYGNAIADAICNYLEGNHYYFVTSRSSDWEEPICIKKPSECPGVRSDIVGITDAVLMEYSNYFWTKENVNLINSFAEHFSDIHPDNVPYDELDKIKMQPRYIDTSINLCNFDLVDPSGKYHTVSFNISLDPFQNIGYWFNFDDMILEEEKYEKKFNTSYDLYKSLEHLSFMDIVKTIQGFKPSELLPDEFKAKLGTEGYNDSFAFAETAVPVKSMKK